ncbi:hypothetical protein M8R21_49175 [Klebsiella sp. T2.Ur]|nr:hypothetical protein [Klebsiella sp. T2.Ur]
MKINYVMGFVLLLALTGCDNTAKFDGTSQESLHNSAQEVNKQLSAEKQEHLRLAISDIISYYETKALVDNDNSYSSEKVRLLILDGKTADQVISEARIYRGKKVKLLLQYQQ